MIQLFEHRDGHAEGWKNHDVGRAEAVDALAGVGQKPDAHASQLVVHVRVVNDFAGQEHVFVGKPLARLVGVIHRAVDAVAEPELAREKDRDRPACRPRHASSPGLF